MKPSIVSHYLHALSKFRVIAEHSSLEFFCIKDSTKGILIAMKLCTTVEGNQAVNLVFGNGFTTV